MSKTIIKAPKAEVLAELKASFPSEPSFSRVLLPRLSFASQDKTEGKGKTLKVVTEAGTFFIERQTDEKDENGKNIWSKTELGKTVEGIILYQRRQLRMYDESTELYTSSPVYDTDSDVVPLFCEKQKVATGTPAELKARYQYQDKDGKTKSKLEDNKILYVLVGDEMLQLNLRGSSMYSFSAYARKVESPNLVLTLMSSEAMEKGSIEWNKMTFTAVRPINGDEAEAVQKATREIIDGIKMEKDHYQKPANDFAGLPVAGSKDF